MRFSRGVFAAIVLLASLSSFAQVREIRLVEYSAKFLCGVSEATRPGGAPVRPGVYETSINIHNPELRAESNVTFVKKVVLALPEGEKPVPPSKFRVDRLQSDFAEHVDCRIIREMLGPAGTAPFIEGFVVLITIPSPLTTPHELDVVGVYTVDTPGTPSQSISLEMVPITPRTLVFPAAAGRQTVDKLMEQAK
jgi:hypothetical protein